LSPAVSLLVSLKWTLTRKVVEPTRFEKLAALCSFGGNAAAVVADVFVMAARLLS
jgi:hypothetical protein